MLFFKELFKKKTPSLDMKKYLIVGLGNIGLEYDNTRHNIGFQILDHLAEKNKVLWETKKLASLSIIKKKGKKFIFIKPTTFMNRSGKAVRYWALQEKVNIENILIVTDDLHLPFGTLRLKGKGSPAGHNGLKDVESELNTPNYARLLFLVFKPINLYFPLNLFIVELSPSKTKFIIISLQSSILSLMCFCSLVFQLSKTNFT